MSCIGENKNNDSFLALSHVQVALTMGRKRCQTEAVMRCNNLAAEAADSTGE